MAFTAPSGLMGKPDNMDGYEEFQVEEITMYIAKDVLENNLKNNILHIYIEGYGRYQFDII